MDEFEGMDMSPEALESAVADIDTASIDEFNSSVNYDKFIVLSKKDLTNFCRIVEPLTKASVDEYGKSVFIKCLDNDTVELRYQNNPYIVCSTIPNKSGKQVRSFCISVAVLKKLTVSSFASLILVEQDNEINISLCESLLYLETKALKESLYEFERKNPVKVIDKEVSTFTFRKIASILSCTERASEKVVVVKNSSVFFNTGIFASRSKSPFDSDEKCVLYKQTADILGVLSEISKVSVKYLIEGGILVASCDDSIYCEMPIGTEDKVQEFLSPTAESIVNFTPTVKIINDTLLRLVSIVQSLDYLSDIVTLKFSKTQMEFVITTSNQSKSSTYKFPIIEGEPEVEGEMKLTVSVLKIFLNIVGMDVTYSFNINGFGIQNELGTFLIRKS